MSLDPAAALWLIGVALVAAVFGLLLLRFAAPGAAPADSIFAERGEEVEFLFDGEVMVDATPAARTLLQYSPLRDGTPWQRLTAWLRTRFPEAMADIGGLPDLGRLSLVTAPEDGAPVALVAEQRGGLMHLRLSPATPTAADAENPLLRRALREELDRLRACVAAAPMPMWQRTAGGEVIWCNRAYLDLAAAALGNDRAVAWPLPALFDTGTGSGRQSVSAGPGRAHWFEVFGTAAGSTQHGFAVPADAAVQAEASLKTFLQTLTRTFAHLPIGLAVFDGARQLALFNPALTDLTGLPPDFLSARPTLAAFLDALRERAMLPEPKDYVTWRRTMADLEQAASGGLFEETWSLPGGQTYRVTGRPHPNGGLALLVEDISTEMTQTRRYRADLELGQAVIDAMDEAVAVFSAAGLLVMSNAAYADLWGHDPASTLDGEMGIAAIGDHWRARTAPTTLWDRAEDYVAAAYGEASWSDTTRLADGRPLACRFAHLAGGATLAAFRVLDEAPAAAKPRGRERPPGPLPAQPAPADTAVS